MEVAPLGAAVHGNSQRSNIMLLKFGRLTQIAYLALIVISCVISAHAQQTTGNVRGIVKDPTSAVVPGAKVTITDKSTNNSQTAQTTEEGEYLFSNLLPGDYSITVEAVNFKTLTLNEVRVELNQTTDIPTELQVGLQSRANASKFIQNR
jgi:hypothetical protein